MKLSLAALAAAIAAFPAVPATAAGLQTAPAAQQPTIGQPSDKARASIVALQTAVKANDTAAIAAKLAAAQAAAKTPTDHYWIAKLQLDAAVASNNLPAIQQAIDAVVATNVVPASQVAGLYASLGDRFDKAKQYDQAVAAFQKASALVPSDENYLLLIAQTRVDQGNKPEAVAALEKAIQMSKAAGKTPDEKLYRNAVGLAYEAKMPNAVSLSREWLTAYPSDDSWKNAIAIYRNMNGGDPNNLLDVLRLARLTKGMQTENDYYAYAAKAHELGDFGEAVSVVDEGIAAGKLKASDPDIAAILKDSKPKVPTPADLAAAEKAARIPTAYIRVGDRYYAAGNYQKAADLYREALAKGADAGLANLRLGEALARSGDKAGATAALNAVGGTRSDLAKFWLLYVQTH